MVRASTVIPLAWILGHPVARPVAAQQTIPVRTLVTTAASDSGVLKSIASLRSLGAGRVLVNDFDGRRLLVLDASLKVVSVIMEGMTGAADHYGTRTRMLMGTTGDSAFVADEASGSLFKIGADGKMAGSVAPPKAADLPYLAITYYGTAAIDPAGRLVYRTFRRDPPRPAPKVPPDSGTTGYAYGIDSAPILRGNFDTRSVDTIAMLHIQVTKSKTFVWNWRGSVVGVLLFNPLPASDEWTLLPDGTVAIVRVHDYHIDWVHPDGTLTSSPVMPFAWVRVTSEDKDRMLDSARKAVAASIAAEPPRPPPPPLASGQPLPTFQFETVDATDLPDYFPPIRAGRVLADREGNVWILPSTAASTGGGLTWDVVNRNGEVFERVQLPVGRTLVGFGPGAIYLSYHPTPALVLLERATFAK